MLNGYRARCGGPSICATCAIDLAELTNRSQTAVQQSSEIIQFPAPKPETEIDLKDALEQMQRAVAALEVAANNLEIAVLNMNIAMAKAK
jgi:hypothetical protein